MRALAGVSKYGISRTFRVILDLIAVYFFMRFRARPNHFSGGIGLVPHRRVVPGPGLDGLGQIGLGKTSAPGPPAVRRRRPDRRPAFHHHRRPREIMARIYFRIGHRLSLLGAARAHLADDEGWQKPQPR